MNKPIGNHFKTLVFNSNFELFFLFVCQATRTHACCSWQCICWWKSRRMRRTL